MGKTHYQELILCLHGKLLYIHKIYPFACNNVPSVKGVKEAQEARRGNQGREVTQILSVMCANLSECFSGSWTISMSLFKGTLA